MTILLAPSYTVLTGLPLPPNPSWELDILPLAGGSALQEDVPFKALRATWAADGPGALEIDLRESDVASGDWQWGRRRLLLRADAQNYFQGWLERLERGGSPGNVSYRVASRGLAAILEQRVVHGNVDIIEDVATDAAKTLLAHMDAQADDTTNFTIGSIIGVARSVTRYFCDGDNIGQAIDELAESVNGFQWEIDANGSFNATTGGFGSDLSATINLTPTKCQDFSVTGDSSEVATYVTGMGSESDDDACGPALVIDLDPLRTTWGRKEEVIDSESNTNEAVEEETGEELRARIASRLKVKAGWIEGRGPWKFGDVWIGDVVNAQLGAPFGGDTPVRCISVTLTLEQGVYQFIDMDFEAA